ncbi:MAG: hypothetical protein QG588_2365 [Candidatus Poribacteria bacterium]|nr:hypothetical protein [Candidatus Poribacteria bacterium]
MSLYSAATITALLAMPDYLYYDSLFGMVLTDMQLDTSTFGMNDVIVIILFRNT